MPFARPTLSEIQERVEADVASRMGLGALLRRGGLFVLSDRNLARLSPVDVELVLPDGTALPPLRGSVVYLVQEDPAKGRASGLGVHFKEADTDSLGPVHALAGRLAPDDG